MVNETEAESVEIPAELLTAFSAALESLTAATTAVLDAAWVESEVETDDPKQASRERMAAGCAEAQKRFAA